MRSWRRDQGRSDRLWPAGPALRSAQAARLTSSTTARMCPVTCSWRVATMPRLTYDAYSLLPDQRRKNLFGRVSNDLTDHVNVFFQVTPRDQLDLRHCVPAVPGRDQRDRRCSGQVRQSLHSGLGTGADDGLGPGFLSGCTMSYDMPWVTAETNRDTNRYVLGATGDSICWPRTGSGKSTPTSVARRAIATRTMRATMRTTLWLWMQCVTGHRDHRLSFDIDQSEQRLRAMGHVGHGRGTARRRSTT